MSIPAAVAIFISCLAISIVSSLVMAKRIEQLGTWLNLSEGLLGLLTALAADAPEIASAITAIVAGNRDLGLGVVFGSNIFNLAALLGAGAITAGCVRVGRAGLWFDGSVGLVVAVIVAVQLFGWIGSVWAVVLVCVALVPYLLISAIKPEQLERMPAHPRLRAALQPRHCRHRARETQGSDTRETLGHRLARGSADIGGGGRCQRRDGEFRLGIGK